MSLSLLIVVLHYRGLDDTLECLASLGKQTYRGAHTIVVDNGSADRLAARLAEDYPWAELVELEQNQGWSGGNNVGIRLAMERNYDVVCLLNNDTVLPAPAVGRLMATLTELGPCLLHPAIDSYGMDDEVQLDPTLPEPVGMSVTRVPGADDAYEIDVVSGCCLLVNVSIFKNIGLIDERFFLLCEDTDLGRRALAAGYRSFCDVSVRIQHKESRSFGGRRSPIKTYYGIRNTFLFAEKHDGFTTGIVRFVRYVAWTVWHTAEASGTRPRSWLGLAYWVVSQDPFALATRLGVRDYVLRRFGRIRTWDETKLTSPVSGPGLASASKTLK